jgi:hypothetical protein
MNFPRKASICETFRKRRGDATLRIVEGLQGCKQQERFPVEYLMRNAKINTQNAKINPGFEGVPIMSTASLDSPYREFFRLIS